MGNSSGTARVGGTIGFSMSRTLIGECHDRNIDAVKHMITNGANIEMTSSNGRTPLYSASSHGHLEIVKFLIINPMVFV